jgi:hypothetical protein
MPTALVQKMARKRGRPAKPETEGTRMVRVPTDIADMIGWIVRIKKKSDAGYTASELVGPMLRPGVTARYKLIESEVEKIKRAEDSASSKAEEEG